MPILLTLWTLITFSNVNYFCASQTTSSTTVKILHYADFGADRENVTMAEPPTVVPARTDHTATIIFLHGISQRGKEWAESLKNIIPPNAKLMCPNANMTNVTVNTQHKNLYSWFNGADIQLHQDPKGVDRATNYLSSLIEKEIADGILPEKIVVGGFSQGGGMALNTVIKFPKKLGGVIALAIDLPKESRFAKKHFITKNRAIPTLHCTGHAQIDYLPLVGALPESDVKRVTHDFQYRMYKGIAHQSDMKMANMKTFFEIALGSA